MDGRNKPDHDEADMNDGREPAIVKRYREPQAPSFAIRGNGNGGGSKRGASPRMGAARSISLPVVTPAFQFSGFTLAPPNWRPGKEQDVPTKG